MRTALANGRISTLASRRSSRIFELKKQGVDEWLEEPRLVINTEGVLSTDRVYCEGLEAPVFALEAFRQRLPQEQAVHADMHRVTDLVQLSAALYHGFVVHAIFCWRRCDRQLLMDTFELENGEGLFLRPVHAAREISAREDRSEAAKPAWDFESRHHLHPPWNLLDFTVKITGHSHTDVYAISRCIAPHWWRALRRHLIQGLIGATPSAELLEESNRLARRSWGEDRQGGCEGRAREGTWYRLRTLQ